MFENQQFCNMRIQIKEFNLQKKPIRFIELDFKNNSKNLYFTKFRFGDQYQLGI